MSLKTFAQLSLAVFWLSWLATIAPSCHAKADVGNDLHELVSELRAIRRVLERGTLCNR